MNGHATFFSQLYHFLSYLMKKPKTQLENGMLIISVDVDVGNKKLGVLNKGRNDINISRRFSEYSIGKIEEQALPMFIDLFDNFEVPATFAIRGQLMEVDDLVLDFLRKSSIKHDIGAHGYYHRPFTNLTRDDAEKELEKTRLVMRKFDISPRSFVFPKNRVAYLDLLEKQGYKCYRGARAYRMHIEKRGSLFNICPGLYVSKDSNSDLVKRMLNVAISRKLPFHIWFHLWNFGQKNEHTRRSINNTFVPLLDYAKRKEKSGVLALETMLSAAEKVERHLDQ